jgi:hypothetical protein
MLIGVGVIRLDNADAPEIALAGHRGTRERARDGLPPGVRAAGTSRTPLNTASRSRPFSVSVL